MLSSKPKTAEANFREAFERLKASVPKVLSVGTPVSQNNVAKEAGCDPTALRKSRFPVLVAEIQTYVASLGDQRPPSERQRLLSARQGSRSKTKIIANLKAQRDDATLRLTEAYELIGVLTLEIRGLQAKLDDAISKPCIMPIPSAKPRAAPRGMDTRDKK